MNLESTCNGDVEKCSERLLTFNLAGKSCRTGGTHYMKDFHGGHYRCSFGRNCQ